MPTPWSSLLSDFSALTVAAVPDGAEALALAELVRSEKRKGLDAVYIARDGQRLQQLQRALAFFAPEVGVLEFPSVEAAETFWHSPEYTEVKKLREGNSEFQVVVASANS